MFFFVLLKQISIALCLLICFGCFFVSLIGFVFVYYYLLFLWKGCGVVYLFS